MKNKIGKILIILGWIFVIISFLMVLYTYYEVNNAYIIANEVLNKVDLMIDRQQFENIEEVEILGEKYIGIIEVPSLNVRLPILKECNDENLKIAPCKYYSTKNNNAPIIIAGHNYPKFFGNIKYLKKGDSISFSSLNGNEHRYIVDKIEMISSEDIDKMINTEYEFSIFSCNYSKDKRITVRCIKEEI